MNQSEAQPEDLAANPPSRKRLEWILLVALCAAAVVLRLIALHQFESSHPLADHPAIDERSYDDWAVEIAAGEWLGEEVFFQEPLYPYFLGSMYSVVGHDRHFARVVQCLLGGLTVYLLWLFTRRLFGKSAAWFAGVGFALYPPAVLMPSLLLKPNLFLPILAALLLVILRRDRKLSSWLVAGLLGGLGALLRGNLLILLPVLALLPFARIKTQALSVSEAVKGAATVVLGIACILLPVMLRNWHVGEVFALTTSGAGTNVYGGNNADNPYGVATEFDWVRGIPRYEANDWRIEAERRLGRELDSGETSSYWLGQVVESMKSQPALHLSIFWNKLRLALGTYEVPDNHHLGWDSRYVPLLRLRWPGFAWIGGFGLAGLLLAALRRELRGAPLELAAGFVLYLGTIVLTVMSMRARLPLVILILPFAGYWFAQLWKEYGRKRGERRPGVIALLVALGMLGAAFVSVPVFDEETLEGDLADRDYNLVVSWLDRGVELQSSSELALELTHRHPTTSRFQTLLATTEWQRGRKALDEGERQVGQDLIRTALERLRPIPTSPGVSARERSRAWRLAGYIQADIGNWKAAESFFRQARDFAPEDLELMVSHAQALIEHGLDLRPEGARLIEEARELLEEVLERAPDSFEAEGARRLLEEL